MPFIPLNASAPEPWAPPDDEPPSRAPVRGFVPLAAPVEPPDHSTESPSVLRNVLLNNPFTAAGEAALNLGSQMVSLPAAGIAGIGAAAGNALGLTDADPAEKVSSHVSTGAVFLP